MRCPLFAAAAIAVGCSGCGSGIVIDRFDGTPATMTGVPYNLPMTSFTVTITRRVVECSSTLKGALQAQIVASKSLDPTAMFTLHSTGWLNTSDIKSAYAADGTTNALNATSTDVTATVISNLVSTVATLAPLLAAAGAAPGAAAVEACLPPVKTAVAEIKTLNDQVTKDTNALAAATDKVTLLTAQIQALGSSADKPVHQALADALGAQDKAKTDLTSDQNKLAADVKLTSDTQTITWPGDGTQLTGGPYSISVDTLNKWGNLANPGFQKAQFDAYLRLDRTGPLGVDATNATSVPTIDVSKGAPVRFAVAGRLSVCAAKPCGDPASTPVGKYEGPILQLGLVYAVPALGGTFKAQTMALAEDTNGAPTQVQVTNTSAAAATATGALKDASTQVAGIPAAINAAELAKIKAESDQITAENTLATAKANNADVSLLAPLQADAALAQARTAKINADAALAAALKAQAKK